MGKKRFYHLFSDGFRTDVLFQDSQAFADGMNIVALTALKAEVRPVVFSLMDNHTHFVLYCDSEECQSFRDIFMHKYAVWKIAPEGFLWPGNYIDYKIVEQLFKTPKSFTYFMGQGKEDEINRSLGIVHSVAMPDMELRAKALRKEYMCSAKQIARIVHLDPKYIKELL